MVFTSEEERNNPLCAGGMIPVDDIFYQKAIIEEVLLTGLVLLYGLSTYGALVPNLVMSRVGPSYKKMIVILFGAFSQFCQFWLLGILIYQVRSKYAEVQCKDIKPFNSAMKSNIANLGLVMSTSFVHLAAAAMFVCYYLVYSLLKCVWNMLRGRERNKLEPTFWDELGNILVTVWLGIWAFVQHYGGMLVNLLHFLGWLVWNMHRFPQWLLARLAVGVTWVGACVKSRWLSIKEDRTYKHSVWMIAAVVTAGLSIAYSALRFADWWSSLVVDYTKYRSCVVENKELFQDLLLGMGFGDREAYGSNIIPGGSGNDTAVREFFLEAATNVGSPDQSRPKPQCLLPRYVTGVYNVVGSRLEANGYDAKGPKDPISDFKESVIGLIVLLLDAMILNSEDIVWIGFGVAALIGFNSLISVLARYKALSCALMDGDLSGAPNTADAPPERMLNKTVTARKMLDDRQIQVSNWKELYDTYSLNSMPLFLGIYVSTAVMQLVLIGSLATWIGAAVAAWRHVLELLQRVSFFVLTYVAVSLLNAIAESSRPVVERAIYEERKLSRPALWVLYTLLRSLLNLAVGLFFSLWRLFLMLGQTFVLFNRLDRVALPRMLDQGHGAFFSMVLMNVTIHMRQNDDDQRNPGSTQMMPLDRTQRECTGTNQCDEGRDADSDGQGRTVMDILTVHCICSVYSIICNHDWPCLSSSVALLHCYMNRILILIHIHAGLFCSSHRWGQPRHIDVQRPRAGTVQCNYVYFALSIESLLCQIYCSDHSSHDLH